MNDDSDFLSTSEIARQAGMSLDWVRKQIQAGRLTATAWKVHGRRYYRVRSADWELFAARYSADAVDEDFGDDSQDDD